MEDSTYYQDGVARVLDVLKDALGTEGLIRTYFNGQPEEIPESSLPCIMVSESDGAIETSATGLDKIVESITIIIALNKKDDLGASPDTDLTEFKLRKLVKGQDPTTKEYLPNTIMYAIRQHITLSNAVISSRVETSFDEEGGAGVNVRGSATVTQEARLRLVIERYAQVPARD